MPPATISMCGTWDLEETGGIPPVPEGRKDAGRTLLRDKKHRSASTTGSLRVRDDTLGVETEGG